MVFNRAQMENWFMKYVITKTNGNPVDPKARYFVLRYDDPARKDHRAVVAALHRYSDVAQHDDPEAGIAALDCLKDVSQISTPSQAPTATVREPKSESAAPTAPQEQPTGCGVGPCPKCDQLPSACKCEPKQSELTAAIERLRADIDKTNPDFQTQFTKDVLTVCNAASRKDQQ